MRQNAPIERLDVWFLFYVNDRCAYRIEYEKWNKSAVEAEQKIVDDEDNFVDDDKFVEDEDKIVKDDDKIVEDEDNIVEDEDNIVKDGDKIEENDDKIEENDYKIEENDYKIEENDDKIDSKNLDVKSVVEEQLLVLDSNQETEEEKIDYPSAEYYDLFTQAQIPLSPKSCAVVSEDDEKSQHHGWGKSYSFPRYSQSIVPENQQKVLNSLSWSKIFDFINL